MKPAEIERLERDTVRAVAPEEILETGGWLVPLDRGVIGRARSAVPLRHDIGPAEVGRIIDIYSDRGLAPRFRIADVAEMAPVCAELDARGLRPEQPTIFKTGSVSDLAGFSEASARILPRPDEAWADVFLGEGFDPHEGAQRVAALTRSPGAIYGAAGEAGETWAVGALSFGESWAGIHGMRTAPSHRGKGLASAILAAFGRAVQARGFARVSLQVEEFNPARRIYRNAGFAPVWRYHYWR